VVATADTAAKILENLQHATVKKILTMVNARSGGGQYVEAKGTRYQIESIIHHPFTYYETLPKNWLYSDVHQVAPDTHLLIRIGEKDTALLWKGIHINTEQIGEETVQSTSNTFLEEVVIPESAFLEGHFDMNGKHMCYLFNVPLLKPYFHNIAEVILKDLAKRLSVVNPPVTLSHVFYPSFNPGMGTLAGMISQELKRTTLTPISAGEWDILSERDASHREVEAALLIDDALVTGDSVFRFYDIIERKGADNIFTYIVINRGSQYASRRFEKVAQYGHAALQTQCLADAEMPSYSENECPICKNIAALKDLRRRVEDIKDLGHYLEAEISRLAVRPVGAVVKEDTEATDVPLGQKADNLRIRWKLELSKRHVGVRHELAKIVRDYETHPEAALCLFEVVANEKHVFLSNERLRRDIFYFEKDIIAACRWFLFSVHELSECQLEAVIAILLVFDPEYVIHHLLDIMTKSAQDENKFLRVITQILLAEKPYNYPSTIITTFQSMDGKGLMNERVLQMVKEVTVFWEKYLEDRKSLLSNGLIQFKKLTAGTYHELRHLRDNVIFYGSSDPVDISRIKENGVAFFEHFDQIIALLRQWTGTNPSLRTVRTLNELVARSELLSISAKDIIEKIERADGGIAIQGPQLIKVVQECYNVIHGKKGITEAIEGFKTNIKTLLYNTLLQQKPFLDAKRMTVEKVLPEDGCIVYGDEVGITTVVQNLVENATKYCKGTRLNIVVEFVDRQHVDILFLNNGPSVKTIEFGDGLRNVRTRISSYCGEFSIIPLGSGDPYFEEGFVTKAVVRLPCFREKEKDNGKTVDASS
jgi:signal transduction histidine kinase